ncbi:unnamed protein product [Paramecium sonneborni]|uniref:EGF-like domain-containing protein n=1 Tax=Paramecium sonneborni TaxID=65129 RepID=A0A8S1NWK9_9CILI|nr:unnamed protein product [Paramecium sonneborni]
MIEIQADATNGDTKGFGFWSKYIANSVFSEEFILNKPFDDPICQTEVCTFHGFYFLKLFDENQLNFAAIILNMNDNPISLTHDFYLFNQDSEIIEQASVNFVASLYENIWYYTLFLYSKNDQKLRFYTNFNNQLFIFQYQIITQKISIILGGYDTDLSQNFVYNLGPLLYFKGYFSPIQEFNTFFYNDNTFDNLFSYCPLQDQKTILEKSDLYRLINFQSIQDDFLLSAYTFILKNQRYTIQCWLKQNYIEAFEYYLKKQGQAYYYLEQSPFSLSQIYNIRNRRMGDQMIDFYYSVDFENNNQTVIHFKAEFIKIPFSVPLYQDEELSKYDTLAINKDYFYDKTQQWHYVVIDQGRNPIDGAKMQIRFYFFNEKPLIYELGTYNYNYQFSGSIVLFSILQREQSSFLKSRTQIGWLIFITGQLEDNNDSYECHSSCKDCNGPTKYNCISCQIELNYFLTQFNSCECSYLNEYNEKSQGCDPIEVSQSLTITTEYSLDQYCFFGYFLVQFQNKYFCIQCPLDHQSGLQCGNCFHESLTWYQKPICTFDYQQEKNSYAYIKYQRSNIDIDIYYIDSEMELQLLEGASEFCETTQLGCYSSMKFHLGIQIRMKCKTNRYYDFYQCQTCVESCIICQSKDICLNCIENYYFNYLNKICQPCPKECKTCQNAPENQFGYLCVICQEQHTLNHLGQCQRCGIYCQYCKEDFNIQTQEYFIRCLKCIDTQIMTIRFNGIDCTIVVIPNCQYVFLVSKSNYFQYDAFNYNFQPSNDLLDEKPICALCQDNYSYLYEQNACLEYEIQMCKIAVIKNFIFNGIDYGPQPVCLKSENQYSLSTIGDECTTSIENCQLCYTKKLKSNAYCLQCLQGYYSSRLTGQCQTCPENLHCKTCYHSTIGYNDEWKINFWNQDQSQNLNDYEIICNFATNTSVKLLNLGIQIRMKCKTNRYYDFYQCQTCVESCIICQSKDICLNCIENYYFNYLNKICQPCPKECKTCQNAPENQFGYLCVICQEQHTLNHLGQCQRCGIYCQYCKEDFNIQTQEYFIRCLKCIDTQIMTIRFNGIDCTIVVIPNCQYVFLVSKSNYFQYDAFNYNFQPSNDLLDEKPICALCQDNYSYLYEQNACLEYEIQMCKIAVIKNFIFNGIDYGPQPVCLKSENQYSLSTIGDECTTSIENCQLCYTKKLKSNAYCLQCLQGYYSSRLTGQCQTCPENLHCKTCYHSTIGYNDEWKINFWNQDQSQNLNDYEIICNFATNTTDSVINIISEQIMFDKVQFINNSYQNIQQLLTNIDWQFPQNLAVTEYNLKNIFQFKSAYGNSHLEADLIIVQNSLIERSQGINGIGFYINGQIVKLINLQFNNLTTFFKYNEENGGCLFIKIPISGCQIEMKNITAKNIITKDYGSFLFIQSNHDRLNLTINNLTFIECISKKGSAFYAAFQKNSLQNLIKLKNIVIKNSQVALLNYLKYLIDNQNNQKALLDLNNRVLIYVENTILLLENTLVEKIFEESLLESLDQGNITLNKIKIFNGTVTRKNIISIQPREDLSISIIIKEIQIQNVSQTEDQNEQCQIQQITQKIYNMQCSSQVDTSIKQLIMNDDKDQTDQIKQSALAVTQIKSNDLILISDIYFSNNNYSKSVCGLIYLQINKKLFDFFSIVIQDLIMNNNFCGKVGCIYINSNVFDETSTLEQQNRLLASNIVQTLQLTNHDIIIQNYQCFENVADLGTCLFSNQTNLIIKNSIFYNNQAIIIGGAMYFCGNQSFQFIVNSNVYNNSANIAGAIYFEDSLRQDIKKYNSLVFDNRASYFGQNIVSTPTHLSITLNNYQYIYNTFVVEKTIYNMIESINNTNQIKQNTIFLPSGTPIKQYKRFNQNKQELESQNLTLRIVALDDQYFKLNNLNNSKCSLEPFIVNIENNKIQENLNQQLISQNTVTFDPISNDYNLDNLIIYFDSKNTNKTYLKLVITCSSIQIPIYDENNLIIQSFHNNYQLFVNINTLKCRVGQIKSLTDNSCHECDPNLDQYSNQLNLNKCYIRDEQSTISVTSFGLNLRQGFWRPYFDNNFIEECQNLRINCLGQWNFGDSSCYTGHIGALCEQCDIQNIRGDGYFSQAQQYSCGSCEDINYNIAQIIGFSIWSLITIILSVKGANSVQNQQLELSNIIKNIYLIESPYLIKILTNYLQIISSLTTFKLNLPVNFFYFLNGVGNPIQQISYSLDCFLNNLTSLDIHYIRLIWQLILPCIYFTILLIIYSILIFVGYTKYKGPIVMTSVIYMYIYFQPSIIGQFIALISTRRISDIP